MCSGVCMKEGNEEVDGKEACQGAGSQGRRVCVTMDE